MRRRFVAVGDSFTEGVGDPNPLYPNGVRGWADRMARQLGRYDDRWRYANLAIRSKYLREVVDEQVDRALSLRPTLITFYAGGNDILTARVNMAAVMDLYEDTVRRLQTSGGQLILFTAYDATRGPILEPVRRRIAFYNSTVRDIARDMNAILIDHDQMAEFGDRRLWSFDRIHMSRPGHKVMAGAVLAELGIPHTLKLPEFSPFERRLTLKTVRDESRWVRSEVVPLIRRRVSGVREGDTLTAKWPELIRPADGMKRLARRHSGDALRVRHEARNG
ncbi:lysophospholipase L1-like esterase [Branchiibius hedensis]|uniref:Lysophospholipase L1 n=1 Tax=Branchiibius hedensis TaxID=672460 RepID=A0A2Y8ZT22_9MICO|nr:SGNH/GDSL hydrolase family protein [Branchiibius hedensis]PWJ26730.1 lysophospholipase L1-like esterase [Branchiibius hedensis]SSA35541.1 Lysophospholipase L1 [Branchiibius hedensis]